MMIYVECKLDFALIRSITKISKREIVHAGGKPEVCKQLERRKNCKGLVDEDPWSIQPPYMKKMRARDLSKHEMKILHDNKGNCLVVLRPRLEEWILRAAKEANVELRKYNLSSDAGKLHEEININIDRFKKLIEDLKDCNRLKILKRLI
jgi:hypothetical protein